MVIPSVKSQKNYKVGERALKLLRCAGLWRHIYYWLRMGFGLLDDQELPVIWLPRQCKMVSKISCNSCPTRFLTAPDSGTQHRRPHAVWASFVRQLCQVTMINVTLNLHTNWQGTFSRFRMWKLDSRQSIGGAVENAGTHWNIHIVSKSYHETLSTQHFANMT